MDNKYDRVIVNKPEIHTSYGEDPDARREEEMKAIKHSNALLFHRWLPKFTIFAFVFLSALIFVILPISEMSSEFENVWDVIRNYSSAFLTANRTIGIAIATLVVSNAMKRLYDYIKDHTKNTE